MEVRISKASKSSNSCKSYKMKINIKNKVDNKFHIVKVETRKCE